MSNLWDLNNSPVESDSCYHSNSWAGFVKEKNWHRNCIYGNTPVYWTWDKYDPDDEDCRPDKLYLIYLSLCPTNVHMLSVDVEDEDQPLVREWLLKHKFLIHQVDV